MQERTENNTILIVEDDPHIINLVSIIFAKSGLKLIEANDGLQALELLHKVTPSLIISDIMMPNLDGYGFRKKLLEQEETKLIPFIFLTAKGKSHDIIHGMELNVDDYIPKPFEPDVFLAKVKATLRRYNNFNELLQYDGLTQVYNRRTLEHNLSTELKRIRCYKESQKDVSILLLDLDHFKNINDTYGHDFGDVVLRTVSDFFKKNLRETDFIGRVGGEEFIIVMPNTEKETAVFVADRLREELTQLNFGRNGLSVSLSGGVAAAPEDATEIEALTKKADVALYTAKSQGRNRIVAAG
jgi:diguanylate cyclase (GGDEF)-like protein